MDGIHLSNGMELKPSLLQFDSLESLPLQTAGEEWRGGWGGSGGGAFEPILTQQFTWSIQFPSK